MSRQVYVLNCKSAELIFSITPRFVFFDDKEKLSEFIRSKVDANFTLDIMNVSLILIRDDGENYDMYETETYDIKRFDVRSFYREDGSLIEPFCFMKTDGPSGECCGLFLTTKKTYFFDSSDYMSNSLDVCGEDGDSFRYTYGSNSKSKFITCEYFGDDNVCSDLMSFELYYDIIYNVIN